MGEQHLDTLSFATLYFERFGLGQCAGNVARLFIDTAWNPAERCLWTASHLERAAPTIGCSRAIMKCLAIVDHRASRREGLVRRADIYVALFVEPEVFPAEGSILALRLIDDRDVRRDIHVVDQPVEVRARTIGRITGEPLGLDTEALLGALNHGLARADFGLADGARGLHIHDDAELHINEIVVGIGEERWPPHRSRPLCSRVGWRDELRGGVARRTKGRIIKGCQILLYCPARRLRITCLLPFRARDRALFVGISLDQARIHGKPFAANEAGCDTSLDHTLEYLTKDAAVAEALIASTRERRMIRDLVLDAELAKPAIGKVHLYLTTQQPLGSQPKNIADDQQALPHRGGTRRTEDPGRCSDAPSSPVSDAKYRQKTESVFAKTFKSLLQQNRHIADDPTAPAFVRYWVVVSTDRRNTLSLREKMECDDG